MRLLTILINAIYWLWLVIVPLIPSTIMGIWLYDKSKDNVPLIVFISIGSLGLGIFFAEKVRKKVGLITFFSKEISTDDIEEKKDK